MMLDGSGRAIPVSPSSPLPGAGGGSGTAASLADILLVDAAGVLFIARDSGTAISYARVDTGAAYVPVAPISVADAPKLTAIVAALQATLSTSDAPTASILDSTSNASYVYFCEAPPGTLSSAAAWRISRLNVATGVTTWAGGTAAYTNIADNRTALAYS
jgi:hypothetical protein